ncbi:hypothetical protein HBI76_190140 [Parastagonospora nodorum]|nr:hypothetical protein HBI76_190140 [Parastagonospora nodorum]
MLGDGSAKCLCPTKGERTFYCACERSPSFNNIGRLTKEEAIEMRIDTTDAISKALAAANKLVALQSYVLGGATKHCLAPLAAQFVIVCGFRKVDKYVFRAYNTISVTAYLAIAKQWRNMIANVKHDASEHESSYNCLYLDFLSTVQNAEQQCRDILEKEGLDKSEASRRVIFNCFEMQAIASYSALATLKVAQFKIYSSCKVKRFTLNSVKDFFTNLSKDYFLLGLREKFSDESVLVMQEGITQHEINLKLLAEMCVSIVYFNLDSELELKVLGKQDVKITS